MVERPKFINHSLKKISTALVLGSVAFVSGCRNSSTPIPNIQSRCRLSQPGDTVLDIALEFEGDVNSEVTIDRGNDGSVDFAGPAVEAPGLVFNAGPRDLGGNPMNDTFQDKVCVEVGSTDTDK